jgi:Squalene-hopene cyclase C-terminal domain/Prenyltransferase and squalene oxidase repeat
MTAIKLSVLAAAAAGVCSLLGGANRPKIEANSPNVDRAVHWLVSVQGNDGGWGQDGGATSYVRSSERLETNGNDVANTAVATLALVHAGNTPVKGEYRSTVRNGVDFILRNVEDSPEEGLAVTRVSGTQIQRKLGPFIDTFLTSTLLSELDGAMGDAQSNRRVRRALEKCVRKIEKNQQQDGSWNISGGWAPILGTSMASRSLDRAAQKGVRVEAATMAKVDEYTKQAQVGAGGGRVSAMAAPASAGVPLYQNAQALEQLSRSDKDRKKNAKEIREITTQLADSKFVNGFGSMGGEEFFSYLNISDSLHRAGGEEWTKWNNQIKTQLARLQNEDGTWAGHHCITGRVAVTSAAVMTLLAERDPVKN